MRPVLALGLLLLAALAALTVASIAPTEVKGEGAPATEFSAARAVKHVEAIAKVPHPVGSPAHEEVRAYIVNTARALGLEVRVQEAAAALKAAGVTHAANVKNVIARLPGKAAPASGPPAPAVMLAAHYDSVGRSRGASDDGSGVATLLETARALAVGPKLANDVLFVFTDAEEVAACGAFAFTEEELAKQPIGVALNFEARGTRGAVALYDTSEANGELIRAVATVVPRVVSTSLLGSLARALPNDSDATVWKRAHIPTYALAYVDHLYQYHQYTDSLEALDLRSLQHDGDYALPLARYLGDWPLPLPAASAVTYFDVFGRTVVSYSTGVAQLLALLTIAALGFVFVRTRRTEELAVRHVALGAGGALAALALAAALAGVVHVVLRLLVPPFVLFARPEVGTAATLLAGIAALLFVEARLLQRRNRAGTVLGALSLWAVLLVATAVFVPAGSFVFQWPLLFATLGAAVWLPRRDVPDARTDAAVVFVLLPAAFFWSYLAYTLYMMVGAQAPEVVVVTVAFPMLLAIPLFARVGPLEVARVASGAWALSVVVLVIGGLAIRTSPDLPRPDSLAYTFDKTHRGAQWTTNEAKHDAFVTQRIPQGAVSASAPIFDLPPLQVTHHSADDDKKRHSALEFSSPAHARCIRFWEVTKEPFTDVRINGKPVPDVVRFSPEIDEQIVRFFAGGPRPSAWVMEYCGAGETGFKLEFDSPRGKRVKLRIIEVFDGIPGPPLAARTPTDGYPENDSDITMAMVDVTP